MTWTNGADPVRDGTADQRRDAVRVESGDTFQPPDAQVASTSNSDEEIIYFLANSSNDVLGAALSAIDSLAAKWTRKPQVAHGPSSVNPSGILDNLEKLRGIVSAKVGMEAPWFAGGLTKSGKTSLAADSDAVQPAFARGMDAHHATDTDSRSAYDEEICS